MFKSITPALKHASDDKLREVLAMADPMALMGLIYHATGDEQLFKIKTITVAAGFSTANIVADEHDAQLVRDLALDLLRDYRDGRRDSPGKIPPGELLKAMSLAAGEPVPGDELGLHSDVLALNSEPQGWGDGPQCGSLDEFNVVVIGAGLAGINAAVQLKASGIDFQLLEKNSGAGGTWYNNRYPGARVDWPSRLYSHSFGVDYPFEHTFAPRAENEAYIRWCAEQYGITPHMKFDCQVTELEWHEGTGIWHIEYRDANGAKQICMARAVISAIGLLERPNIPEFPGMTSFKGQVFHSSRFDPNADLAGKRVGIIGTGASGMQMVPDLGPLVQHVTVFQRTPGWVLPVPGYRDPLPEPMRWLNENVPYYTNWTRFVFGWLLGDHKLFKVFDVDPDWSDPHSVNPVNRDAREGALAHLRQKLASRPDLIDICTPDYPIFANRPVIDNGWFDSLLRENTSLVTDGIRQFTELGIETNDGQDHALDIIILATGFTPNNLFADLTILGRDGVRLDQVWEDGPRAYWGVTVPYMPNFFMMYGPNANPRNLGPVQYGEWVVGYILECFRLMIENNWHSMEITEEAYERFNRELDIELNKIVSVNPRTRRMSYYNKQQGGSAVQSPWSSKQVWQGLSHPNLSHYRIEDGAHGVISNPYGRSVRAG